MYQRLMARLPLLVLSCAAISTAAPFSLGFLTLNEVGSNKTPEGFVEFRLTNWNGLTKLDGSPFSDFGTPITFMNVTLDITWADDAPPGVIGPLDWYLDGDEGHASRINLANLAPNVLSYESTRFQKKYGIEKGVLKMDLTPASGWSVNGGGSYTPPSSSYELVFFITPPANFGLSSDSTGQSENVWDLEFARNAVPEPATYLMGGMGVLAVLLGRRYRTAN